MARTKVTKALQNRIRMINSCLSTLKSIPESVSVRNKKYLKDSLDTINRGVDRLTECFINSSNRDVLCNLLIRGLNRKHSLDIIKAIEKLNERSKFRENVRVAYERFIRKIIASIIEEKDYDLITSKLQARRKNFLIELATARTESEAPPTSTPCSSSDDSNVTVDVVGIAGTETILTRLRSYAANSANSQNNTSQTSQTGTPAQPPPKAKSQLNSTLNRTQDFMTIGSLYELIALFGELNSRCSAYIHDDIENLSQIANMRILAEILLVILRKLIDRRQSDVNKNIGYTKYNNVKLVFETLKRCEKLIENTRHIVKDQSKRFYYLFMDIEDLHSSFMAFKSLIRNEDDEEYDY